MSEQAAEVSERMLQWLRHGVLEGKISINDVRHLLPPSSDKAMGNQEEFPGMSAPQRRSFWDLARFRMDEVYSKEHGIWVEPPDPEPINWIKFLLGMLITIIGVCFIVIICAWFSVS